jgi:hypothetical protein
MPSWRPDTAQQRLWLGPGRHRRGRRYPGTNAKCFAHSCVKRYPLRRYHTNSYANCNSNGYRYANRDSDSDSYHYSNPYCHRIGYGQLYAQTDPDTALRAVTETSTDTSAETVEILAARKFLAWLRATSYDGRAFVIRAFLAGSHEVAPYWQTRRRAYMAGRGVFCTPIF